MTSRTGGLINCWRGLIVWNPFICKFHQDPSFCGDHPLSSSTIDSPIPVACISPSSPHLRSLTSAPTYSTAPSRRTSTMALFGPAPHVVPRGTMPGAWWWPAFSHRALGPMPLAACAERGVQWSGPSWRWEAVMERGFPVVEPSDCASTMTKSLGSHWKMELQKEEVLSVLVRSRMVHLRLKAIR